MKDLVNHPPHYNKGIETTQYIKSWEMNWDQANVIKYISRYNIIHPPLKILKSNRFKITNEILDLYIGCNR